jgi:hypothetical protein
LLETVTFALVDENARVTGIAALFDFAPETVLDA